MDKFSPYIFLWALMKVKETREVAGYMNNIVQCQMIIYVNIP